MNFFSRSQILVSNENTLCQDFYTLQQLKMAIIKDQVICKMLQRDLAQAELHYQQLIKEYQSLLEDHGKHQNALLALEMHDTHSKKSKQIGSYQAFFHEQHLAAAAKCWKMAAVIYDRILTIEFSIQELQVRINHLHEQSLINQRHFKAKQRELNQPSVRPLEPNLDNSHEDNLSAWFELKCHV